MEKLPPSSRETLLRLFGYFKPYWKIFAGGILAMVLLAASEAGIPALLKPVLDGTFVERDPFYLKWAPLALVALFLVRGLAQLGSSAAFAAISTRLMHRLREEMFERLLSLPTAFYERTISGNVISRFTYDVSQISHAGIQLFNALIKDSLTVIGLLVYVFWLDWQLSLFTFILLPTVALIAKYVGRRQRRLSRALQERFGDMTHILEETTRGHKVIKIHGGQDYERSRFDRIAKAIRHQQFKLAVASTIGVPIVEFVGASIMAAVIWIGTNRAVEDQLTVGGFVAFFTALGLLFSPVKRLIKLTDPLQRGLAAAESVFALLDELPEQDTGTRQIERPRGELRFEQVRFRYPGAERDALGPLDLTIAPNSFTALVGASGSGKSTFVSLIPRLHEVTGGRILLDGIDIRELALPALRRHVAFVDQQVILFNDSIAANIAYGMQADHDRIRQAAKDAGALEFIEALPEGFDTPIGENGVKLSGGQRQRLAIARALITDARILILDEATSALDTESERLVQQGLERLREGRTTLVIAHRLSTVQKADRILVFEQGKIIEEGTHEELMARRGAYYRLNQAQLFGKHEGAADV
ncbi:MAG: lipid A export permease/ATP-binding protein MsbA [Gammaproteobacteria bacterium]|nr:MAG: lipid A export permease/ATP-binding protein MsbA [Gammaproteobacteria bacterium]